MPPVGNDIVDLAAPGNPGKSRDGRFCGRVFTAEERALIDGAADPDALLWALWAAKEAAYKAVSRTDPSVCSIPRQYRVEINRDSSRFIFHGEFNRELSLLNAPANKNVKGLHAESRIESGAGFATAFCTVPDSRFRGKGNIDALVKSQKSKTSSVIPAKAGIQEQWMVTKHGTPAFAGVTTFYGAVNIGMDGYPGNFLIGRVITPRGDLGVRIESTGDWVHALAAESEEVLDRIILRVESRDGVDDPSAFVRKGLLREISGYLDCQARDISVVEDPDCPAAPRLLFRGSPLTNEVSLSHDGRFTAFAFDPDTLPLPGSAFFSSEVPPPSGECR